MRSASRGIGGPASRAVVSGIACAVLACSGTTTTSSVGAGSPAATSGTSGPIVEAAPGSFAPSGKAPPPRTVASSSSSGASSAAPSPSSPLAPPPLANEPFAELFAKDKSLVYIVRDRVDTHDARPGKNVLERTARVRFTVSSVERDGGSWLAEGSWQAVSGPGSGAGDGLLEAGTPPTSWRLRGEGLEIGDDGDHLVLVTAAAVLAAARATKKSVCHVTRDQGMYGPTTRELCFDTRGLVRYAEENLHGPRQFSLVRVGP